MRLRTVLSVSLAVALVIAVGVAALEWGIASDYHSRLTGISPCDGGLGLSNGCPPPIGATFVQLGEGVFSHGSWTYAFIVAPHSPPNVYANSLTLRVYNATSNATLTLLNVTLSAPNGTSLATYGPVGGVWNTSSAADIWEVDLLNFSSSTNLAGDWAFIWDSAASNGHYSPLA